MKPEDQNIAIAKVCGWKLKWQNVGGGDLFDSKPKGHSWEVWIPPAIWYQSKEGLAFTRDRESWNPQPPNYLNDLNAMHEAEKILEWTPERAGRMTDYALALYKIVGLEVLDYVETSAVLLRATASQRAEAFLKTLNMWKE